jgi:uncharacterized protein (DUF2164 family)
MKREIKFRVFNGHSMECNVMAGFLGHFYVQGMDAVDAASMSNFNTKYFDSVPLMQFTGLKDKNGKEIYEGDVIQERSKKDWHSKVDAVFVVEFGEQDLGHSSYQQTIGWNATPIHSYGKPSGMDSGRLSKGILSLCLFHPGIDCEVIGNIYENPELLTK